MLISTRQLALIVCLGSSLFMMSQPPANAQHRHGSGHPGGAYSGGHYRGSSHYRGGYGRGYSGSNFSISIGSGLGYGGLGYGSFGYGGLGYDGLGYGAFGYPGPGYGYGGLGGVGYNNYGLSSYGLGLTSGLAIGRFDGVSPYASAYRGFYGSTPYYSPRYGLPLSEVDVNVYASPLNGYVPTPRYGVPGYSSEYSHQPSSSPEPYSAGRFDETYPDSQAATGSVDGELRPGMILPDGSKVISVGPLGAPGESQPTEVAEPATGEL